MNYDDTYIGTVFLAPASYLIEELQEQEKEVFKNRVFQYDNLVCGIVDKIDSKRGYGLTKGQFSATADKGSKSKRGVVNSDSPIDLVSLALQLGATYVARSFSGDKEQLIPLIKGALRHRGSALIDVISPCVTFNNHAGSTRSYDYVREHNEAVNRLDVILPRDKIEATYAPGALRRVVQHDGSILMLRKVDHDYDPTDRVGAMNYLQERQALGEIVTGLPRRAAAQH